MSCPDLYIFMHQYTQIHAPHIHISSNQSGPHKKVEVSLTIQQHLVHSEKENDYTGIGVGVHS